jgi:S1-C subfamily serine protease
VSPPRPAAASSEPRVEAELHDGRKLTARIIGRDFLGDLALLKLESENPFPYLELGEAKSVQVGEILIAVGNPFGVLANSVSLGILSGRGRQLMQGQMFGGLLQTDATIHPGNSGGPLLNVRGEVVAVSNAKITGAGLGFAIPIDEAKRVLPELLSAGSPARGYLGLRFEDDSASTDGTVIEFVEPRSPADRAGLKKGDIVTTVLGSKVHSLQDVTNVVGARHPGERIEITFLRDGKDQSLEIVLGRRPPR